MEEVRKSASYTLAEIAHAMESRAHPNAKLRLIAAVTAQHTDYVYSALGRPDETRPDDEPDDPWPDEASPDVYCPEDTWEIEAFGIGMSTGLKYARSRSSASAPLITSTSAAALDATESTSGSSASTGIRKHTGEPLLQSPIVKKARPARNPTTPPKTPTPPKYPPPHRRPGGNTDTF